MEQTKSLSRVTVCECNEASGLCGSVNKASDDAYFHFDTLQMKKYDFFLEEGTDSWCCENGCEANCSQTQRNLDSYRASTLQQYCLDNTGCPLNDSEPYSFDSLQYHCIKQGEID